ncbi:hypothetical protein, partial [Microcoleus sp.]|uniref:hypothetical protein n=1 Tax=Microcoleus sp. TaxID=44472 RepID=UPI00403E5322
CEVEGGEERNPVSANRFNESRIERVFRPESVKPVMDLSLSLSRILIFTSVPDKKKRQKKRELRK